MPRKLGKGRCFLLQVTGSGDNTTLLLKCWYLIQALSWVEEAKRKSGRRSHGVLVLSIRGNRLKLFWVLHGLYPNRPIRGIVCSIKSRLISRW